MGLLDSMFLNIGGLIFLGFLIPLLLLYLIKPKPLKKTIPSLLFILQDAGKSNINRLFRNWFTDILLLLHFLLFIFLILSLAQPYVQVAQSVFVEDTIIIIDVSASMRIADRFEEAQEFAIDNLANRNTIILAHGTPEVLVEAAATTSARKILRALEPTDTTTNLADALTLASSYVGVNSNVVIVSDFLPSEGSLDVASQINALESKGAIITQKIIGEPVDNVGLIDLSVRDEETKVWVKNFALTPKDATISVGDAQQTVLLAKQETKELTFTTPSGVTEIVLAEKDDFMADNTLWMSTPADNSIDMLVYTNAQEKFEQSNLFLALGIIEENFPVELNIEYAIFPKVPDLNHDVYVFYQVDTTLIIPGHIRELKDAVENGASVVLTAQAGLFGIDFQGLLPVTYIDSGVPGSLSAAKNLLTKEINFGQVQSYARVSANDGVTVVAHVQDDPIITLNKVGKGTVVYYGLEEGKESFSAENSYPVFWRRLLDLLTARPTLRSLNVQTGTLLSFAKEERITTPSGKEFTQLLRAQHAGLYVLPDRTIAANLLSDLESNTLREPVREVVSAAGDAEEKKLPKNLADTFLIIGFILLLAELLYLKFRGDL